MSTSEESQSGEESQIGEESQSSDESQATSSESESQTTSDPTPEELALQDHLKQLSHAIVRKPPYCQGTIPLPADEFTLYYGKDEIARRLNLADASPEGLQHLAETCDPATFGLGDEDVYDETYRKAGKLDASDFMIRFTPDALGLLDIIRTELLVEGRSSAESIRAELYKLNVYGPEAFFKAHVDTPRSELMFGSLVIVFPTTHEGGALVLRERDADDIQEWTFDSAALLAEVAQPSIAYVAFYSDVEHEVMPVQSGHRVTVTYNLYYIEDITPLPVAKPIPSNEHTFRSKMQALLDDPTFLPEGGNLMFPLRHQYPLSTTPKSETEAREALQNVATHLKATDALVLKVMRDLSLDASLKIVYQDISVYSGIHYVMCDRVVRLEDESEVHESLHEHLLREYGGVLLNPSSWWNDFYNRFPKTQVHWIPRIPWYVNSTRTTYMAYGNQHEIAHTYWKISMYVRVGPAGNRATASEVGVAPSEN